MRLLVTVVLFLAALGWGRAQAQTQERCTISGYIREAGSREALLGATVRVVGQPLGTNANTFGFYSITLPKADSVTLLVALVGYQPRLQTVALRQSLTVNVELQAGEQLREVVVKSSRAEEKVSDSPQMSQLELPISQLKKIPALLGEKDVLKVLQLMPGVQKGAEGQSGLYVRGLDYSPYPSPQHS